MFVFFAFNPEIISTSKNFWTRSKVLSGKSFILPEISTKPMLLLMITRSEFLASQLSMADSPSWTSEGTISTSNSGAGRAITEGSEVPAEVEVGGASDRGTGGGLRPQPRAVKRARRHRPDSNCRVRFLILILLDPFVTTARTMHKFSTAAMKSSALPVLHSVGLLNVLQRVRLRGPLSRALSVRRFRRFVTRTYA